jgi:hypothetical protein
MQQSRIGRATRKAPRLNPLRSVYGEMIVQKGTFLYHTSASPFVYNPSKPMLFLTFHPSEWNKPHSNEYVTKFKVQRDISLLFMVGGVSKTGIAPLLDGLIGTPGKNLAKMVDAKLWCFIHYLKGSGFDGWFSTIEGGLPVEVALINDPILVQVIGTRPLNNNTWKNAYYKEPDYTDLVAKDWGNVYEISIRHKPVQLKIHRRYEHMINKFMDDVRGGGDPDGHIVYILLQNARISYIDAPFQGIRWAC